ncbi:MAG: S8 family serine peptidase [Flavobacteriales bacterium]|nr:MAG: S8 family serine peptidase [Flavobacteriales bacterium]
MKKTLTLCAIALLSWSSASAQLNETEYVPGDILVMLKPGMEARRIAEDLATLDGSPTGLIVMEEVSAPMRAWLLRFDPERQSQWSMLRAVRSHGAVQLAQNNHIVKERAVPDDPQYSQVWHHQNIDSEAAWDISTGGITATGDTIVVAIIENADLTHPDLTANAWINYDEIPGNGIDDDGNGYIDDRRGWNTPSNNDNVYSGSHGTQCAGMAGATGNNGAGVVGANWSVKLMPVNYGGTNEAAVVAAYTYPLRMRRLYNSSNGVRGAFVVATSASWGIDGGQPANSPLWCAMFDTLGTAGILNCGATANNAVNVDVVGDLPTACGSDYMISVTATNNNDQRTFSAWGATTIDVGAPGESVRTTSIGGGYGNTSGTSFATPLTAGVIGLLYSAPCASLMALVQADPQEGALYVRQKLFEGVEQAGNLPGNTVTGGRISSGNSMQLIMAGCGTCPAPYGGLAARNGTSATYSWNSTGEGPFNVRYRLLGTEEWTELAEVAEPEVVVDGLDPCLGYEFQVEVLCDEESSGYSPSTILAAPSEGAPVITASAYPVVCAGTPLTLTSSTASGITWSTGAQTASIAPVESGSYTVTLAGQCGTYASDPFEVTVIPVPEAPTAANVQLPGPGTATLSASGSGITWYDAPAGGTAVGSGNDWNTPFLSATTSFWCTSSADNGAVSSYGAKTANSTSGQHHTNANNYQVFTANQTFMIRSVKVYANAAGTRPIALVDGSGNTLVQGNFSIPAGESRVQLDFTVPGPGTYGLRVASGNPGLWRDGLGSAQSYPYPLGGFGSITTSTATGGNGLSYYYFFYDWEVSLPAVRCESERTQVTVEMPQSVDDQERPSVRIFPHPADRDLFIDAEGAWAQGRLLMTVHDATGRQVAQKAMENGRATLTTAFLANGMYAYRIERDGETVHQGRFVVEHLW